MSKVTILRGPSGAGKSTLLKREILKSGEQVTVVSADKFFEKSRTEFTDTGPHEIPYYDFDPTKLPEAHAKCMEEFLMALMHGQEHVVVDNTNTQWWEYHNYELAARMAGYEVEIIEIVPKTVDEVKLCIERNVHRVPADIVMKMVLRFEHDKRAIELPILQ